VSHKKGDLHLSTCAKFALCVTNKGLGIHDAQVRMHALDVFIRCSARLYAHTAFCPGSVFAVKQCCARSSAAAEGVIVCMA
jgi:hypothetical protein